MQTSEMTSVDFYDSLWAHTRRVDEHHKCRVRAIQRMLKLVSGGHRRDYRLREPACGSGIISRVLAEWGNVTGFDQSRVGVEQTCATVRGSFFVGRLPEIPVADDDFDLCVLSQVLEHFQRDDQAVILRNIRRHLKTDGHLILTTPNRRLSGRMAFKPGELQPIENWLQPEELVRLLEATGWHVARVRFCFSFFPVTISRFSWLRPARYLVYELLKLRSLFEDWAESSRFGDTTVVLARKR